MIVRVMNKMKRLWITGYRSYELGVFSEQSPKFKVLEFVLKEQLAQFIDRGYSWFITGAQLGIEQWSVFVAAQLKVKFPHTFQIAVMLPFLHLGQHWNSHNQLQMRKVIQLADFSRSVSNFPYQTPTQLFNYQDFMLAHTDAALLIYDPAYPGKTKYDYREIKRYANTHHYPITLLTMDDLQDAANEYELIYREKHYRG